MYAAVSLLLLGPIECLNLRHTMRFSCPYSISDLQLPCLETFKLPQPCIATPLHMAQVRVLLESLVDSDMQVEFRVWG